MGRIEATADGARVILLGASDYPYQPHLSNPRFRDSAAAVRDYFLDPAGFGLRADNWLDLFDAETEAPGQYERIKAFLQQRATGQTDVLVYYIGHGSVDGREFMLSQRSSRPDAPYTRLRFKDLHQVVRAEARHARKFFVLDCCFAGAAMRELMSDDGPTQLAIASAKEAARDDEAHKGTALLCASSQDEAARAPEGETLTMFTGALLQALRSGPGEARQLTLNQARDRAWDVMRKRFAGQAVRPQVHSPDQSQGDIAATVALLRERVEAGAAAQRLAAAGTIADVLAGGLPPGKDALRCVVVSRERALEPLEDPLLKHVRLALELAAPAIAAEAGHSAAPILAELAVARAYTSEDQLARAVHALCQAEAVVFDLTGFEPGVVFLLGVRSVARRGVTICSVGGKDHLAGDQLDIPFNLQLLNLAAHSARQVKMGPGLRPKELLARKLVSGLHDAASRPRYLDLPAFDAVRELGLQSSDYKGIGHAKEVLVLCPFSTSYRERNWERTIDAELPGKLVKHLRDQEVPVDAQPRLARLVDLDTPRLVTQTLFESIRRTDMCLVDWTGLRANVMFEAGVRMATNRLGAVHIVEQREDGAFALPEDPPPPPHAALMLQLFDPVPYSCESGVVEPFEAMIGRFETALEQDRAGHVGAIYRAMGEALDDDVSAHPSAVDEDLVHEANLLFSDDQESTGISPILFHDVASTLVERSRRAAEERRLAAWLYMHHRYSGTDLAADAQRALRFDLLSVQVRRWARQAGRQDLVALIGASSVRPSADPGADLASVAARVKARKEEAKDCRDAGDLKGAVDVLTQTVTMLKASRWYASMLDSAEVGEGEKAVAAHLADCLGMLGGNHRRMKSLELALAAFEEGSRWEGDDRLDVQSSYNLVNEIVLPLEMGRSTATEQRNRLRIAVDAIGRQVHGARRNDRWAWADLGQCQLLLDDLPGARTSYARVRSLGDADTLRSVLPVLQKLKDALRDERDAAIAEALGAGIAELSG